MFRFSICALLLLASAGLAGESEEFVQLRAARHVQNRRKPTEPEIVAKLETFIEQYTRFLNRYPKSPNFGTVSLWRGQARNQLYHIKKDVGILRRMDPELKDALTQKLKPQNRKTIYRLLLFSAITKNDVISAKTLFLDIVDNHPDVPKADRLLSMAADVLSVKPHLKFLEAQSERILSDTDNPGPLVQWAKTFRQRKTIGRKLRFQLGKNRIFKIDHWEGKVIIIQFWSPASPNAVRQILFLSRLYRRWRQHGLEIVSICLDPRTRLFARFLHENDLGWTHACQLKAFNSKPAKQFGITHVPWLFLIDRNGNLIAQNPSNADLEKTIPTLIKEKNAQKKSQ